jgi:uncharacterized Fe-S center protein
VNVGEIFHSDAIKERYTEGDSFMAESCVYFANIEKVVPGKALSTWGIDKLCEKTGLGDLVDEGDSVAIKMHPGDAYCHRTIRPPFIGRIVKNIKEADGKPFAAEATPLYTGTRTTAEDLLASFRINGYTEETIGCPVVSAEGQDVSLTGEQPYRGDDVLLPVSDGDELEHHHIAAAFVEADVLITCAEMSPTGGPRGILKHIGMGCSSKRGKISIHEVTKVMVDPEKCTGCGCCEMPCPVGAIHVVDGCAQVDYEKCVGCCLCWDFCNTIGSEALYNSLENGRRFHKRLVEAASSLIKQKNGKCLYFGFLMDITGECECHQHSLRPYLPDIGILASTDPVALEAAGRDLLLDSPGVPGSLADRKGWLGKVSDKFHSGEWRRMLEHAEKMGLGTQDYKLVKIRFPVSPKMVYMP